MPPDDSAARVPLGPVGRYAIENLEELRAARRLTYKQLADRLEELGRPIPTLGLSRIEKGNRRVDVDDLVALAIALGVNPTALLLPRRSAPGDAIELTSTMETAARDAWEWADGLAPLRAPDGTPADPADFDRHARPVWRATSVRRMLEEFVPRIEALGEAAQARAADEQARAAEEAQQPVVAAIVTSSEGVLITARKDHDPPWGFVTGAIRLRESPEFAAEREVKEETGLEVRADEVLGERQHPKTHRHMIYIAAKPTRGTGVYVGDQAELADVRWASLAEANALLPTMYERVREYLARELGEA